MMKLLVTILLLLPCFANAINVGPVTTFMHSDKDIVNKTIKNESNEARVVLITVEEISSPFEDSVVINSQPSELLLTPSKMIMPANSESNIRFFYEGDKDDKERYYRVYWTDTNLSTSNNNDNSNKVAVASTTAVIGTILVVNPRVENFDYQFNKSSLTLKNSGNSSFRTIAYGPCIIDSERNCRESYNLLPGNSRQFSRVDLSHENGFLGIWHRNNFITVK